MSVRLSKDLQIHDLICPKLAYQIVELRSVINSFASAALRTLCFGCKQLSSDEMHDGDKIRLPEQGLVCLAIVGIKDPCRPGVPEAVAQCQTAGIKVLFTIVSLGLVPLDYRTWLMYIFPESDVPKCHWKA